MYHGVYNTHTWYVQPTKLDPFDLKAYCNWSIVVARIFIVTYIRGNICDFFHINNINKIIIYLDNTSKNWGIDFLTIFFIRTHLEINSQQSISKHAFFKKIQLWNRFLGNQFYSFFKIFLFLLFIYFSFLIIYIYVLFKLKIILLCICCC